MKDQTIFSTILAENKKIRASLLALMTEALQTSPPIDDYAIFGLGSLARGEMMKGSDVEFAVLLPDGLASETKKAATEYFDQFTDLLKKLLEENDFFKDLGITLDGAGTHPSGTKDKKNRLIGDKHDLLIFHEPKFWKGRGNTHQENPYLFTLLGNSILLKATSTMAEHYKTYVTDRSKMITSQKGRLSASLVDSVAKHKPLYPRFHENKEWYNSKYEFYRIPNLLLDHLDLYYALDISPDSTRDIETRLRLLIPESRTISDSQQPIREAMATALQIRQEIGKKLSPEDNEICNTIAELNRLLGKLYDAIEEKFTPTYPLSDYFDISEYRDAHKHGHKRRAWGLKHGNKKDLSAASDIMKGALKNKNAPYSAHHLAAQIAARCERRNDAIAILESCKAIEAPIDTIKKRRKLASFYKQENRLDDAKTHYMTALRSLCSEITYRASSDTPRILLIKTLMGLHEMPLNHNELMIIKKQLETLDKGHFEKIQTSLSSFSSKEGLKALSQSIATLLHDSERRERVINHYINPRPRHSTANTKKIYHIPNDNNRFIGRKEPLRLLKEKLHNQQHTAITQTVSGLGGIGKSKLAKHFAQTHREQYGVMFWFDSNQPLLEQWVTLAQKLNETYDSGILILTAPGGVMNHSIPFDDQQKERLITKTYKALEATNKAWLFIFDDARDKAAIAPYLPASSNSHHGHIIITSRDQTCWDSTLTLEYFTPAESMSYISAELNQPCRSLDALQQQYQNDGDDKFSTHLASETERQALALARMLGHHPLALSQAVAYIKKYSTMKDYCQSFRENPVAQWSDVNALFEGQKLNLTSGHTVYGTLSLSLEKIATEAQGKDIIARNAKSALFLLGASAFLNNQHIDYKLVEALLLSSGRIARDATPAMTRRYIQSALGTLLEHSLIQHHDREGHFYQLHQLVQLTTRMKLSTGIDMGGVSHVSMLHFLNDQMGYSRCVGTDILAKNKMLYPHIEAILAIRGEETHTDIGCDLWHKLGQYDYYGKREYNPDNQHLKQALELSQTRDNNGLKQASILNDMGLGFSFGKENECIKLIERALEVNGENTNSASKEVRAVSYTILSQLEGDRARYNASLKYNKEALALLKEVHGQEEHPEMAEAIYVIGSVYNSQGHYSEALSKYQDALRIFKQAYDERHPDVAITINQIGSIYNSQGHYSEALSKYQDALRIFKQDYGEKHPEVAAIIHGIGDVYYSQGQYSEAFGNYQDALGIYKQAYGEEHPSVAATIHQIGNVYHNQGQYSKALGNYQKALEMKKRAYSEEHPDVATTIHQMGNVYYSQGQFNKALGNYQDALRIQKQAYGEEHPSVAIAINGIGNVYYSQNQYSEALGSYQKALRVKKQAYGEEHPSVATTIHQIGNVYCRQGHYSEALGNYKEALRIKKQAYGEEHPSVAATIHAMGNVYDSQDKYSEALDKYHEALRIYCHFYNEEHPYITSIKDDIDSLPPAAKRPRRMALGCLDGKKKEDLQR